MKVTLNFKNGKIQGMEAVREIAKAMKLLVRNGGVNTDKKVVNVCIVEKNDLTIHKFTVPYDIDEEGVKRVIEQLKKAKYELMRYEDVIEEKAFEI